VTALPAVLDDSFGVAVVDRSTGEMVALSEASDHAIASAAAELAEHDRTVYELKRALAAEMRERHSVGKSEAGGYAFTVAEAQSWPVGATREALLVLLRDGHITDADMRRCLPMKPKPDATQLKALLGRLDDPEAYRVLVSARTVSPPSLKEVRAVAVDASTDIAA
jgi:hypothetical protein